MCLVDDNVNKSKVQIEHEDNTTNNLKDSNNFNVKNSIVNEIIVPLCESTIEKTFNDYEDVTDEGRII